MIEPMGIVANMVAPTSMIMMTAITFMTAVVVQNSVLTDIEKKRKKEKVYAGKRV